MIPMLHIKIGLRCAVCMMTVLPMLDGCNMTAGIDTLLSAPRLTAQQEEIYQKLQSAAGVGISLKYPKSGEHLSAFTFTDLDDDGDDEAIVFYEIAGTAAEENPLRVCLLDQYEGAWTAVKDYTTLGAEIESVSVRKLGAHDRNNLLLCYSTVDGAAHAVQVLHYADGSLQNSLSEKYTVMDVRDLDGDGTNELLLVSAASASEAACIRVYHLDASGSYYQSELALPDAFTDISRLLYGTYPSDLPSEEENGVAVYLDGMTGATTMQTEVIRYVDRKLKLLYADSPENYPATNRTAGCMSMDIDGDGEIEIPIQTVFYGYTDAEESEQMPMTSWYVCRGGSLMRKKASYYSGKNGYVFLLPQRWEKKVTVISEDDMIVFYTLDAEKTAEEGELSVGEPLLRLSVTGDAAEAELKESEGYLLLRQKGDLRYYGKIEAADTPLSLTRSDLLFGMRYF